MNLPGIVGKKVRRVGWFGRRIYQPALHWRTNEACDLDFVSRGSSSPPKQEMTDRGYFHPVCVVPVHQVTLQYRQPIFSSRTTCGRGQITTTNEFPSDLATCRQSTTTTCHVQNGDFQQTRPVACHTQTQSTWKYPVRKGCSCPPTGPGVDRKFHPILEFWDKFQSNVRSVSVCLRESYCDLQRLVDFLCPTVQTRTYSHLNFICLCQAEIWKQNRVIDVSGDEIFQWGNFVPGLKKFPWWKLVGPGHGGAEVSLLSRQKSTILASCQVISCVTFDSNEFHCSARSATSPFRLFWLKLHLFQIGTRFLYGHSVHQMMVCNLMFLLSQMFLLGHTSSHHWFSFRWSRSTQKRVISMSTMQLDKSGRIAFGFLRETGGHTNKKTDIQT